LAVLRAHRRLLSLRSESGVTLLEMLIVMTIIGVLAAISFPSVNSGLDTLRIRSATDSIVSFLNAGLLRAERRNEAIEVTISRTENTLILRSAEPGFERRLPMPDGVRIQQILPPSPIGEEEQQRSYLLHPGGTVPRFGVEVRNTRGARRIVRVDPITGVPQVETP
jgi:prepilin-type N-terminal cleavage/methylation domain-containing protein